MNYYKARQRQSDGKWDYTCGHDGGGMYPVYPIGYCTALPNITDASIYPFSPEEIQLFQENVSKFHTSGHNTPEEACECYKQYCLDFHSRFGIEDNHVQKKCKVCGEWTTLYALVDSSVFQLCEKHNNRDEVEKLFKTPGEIWSS